MTVLESTTTLGMTTSDVITLLVFITTLVISVVGTYVALNNKITKLESSSETNRDEIRAVESRCNLKIHDTESRTNENMNRINSRLDDTDKKLDDIRKDVNDIPFKIAELNKDN